MSKVENFAKLVVEKLGASKAGADPLTILAFIKTVIDTLMEVIENCPNNNAAKIAATAKNPGLFNEVRFNRMVRKIWRGLEDSGYTYDQVADACRAVAAEQSVEELTDVVKEITTNDYILI